MNKNAYSTFDLSARRSAQMGINMNHFTMEDMQNMQRELQEKYKEKWGGLSPEKALRQMLWLYGELGEAGDIIKKEGSSQIMGDTAVREHFIEELCDVMMYFNDVMLCYNISPQEFEQVYRKKHHTNMGRWQETPQK